MHLKCIFLENKPSVYPADRTQFWLQFSLFFLILTFLHSQSPLSERYHTYEEIQEQLEIWDEDFSDSVDIYPGSGIIYHLEEIGFSTEDSLPFWGVRLSNDADTMEDEPGVLFLGQCHAEEIYGVEITMELIDWFLHPLEHQTFSQNMMAILQSSEVWVIPTYNPEGLQVVHGYESNGNWLQDVTFRKNKRDVNQNGLFDFVEGVGNDSDGVDLNRNYDFNWIFGDDKWVEDIGSGSYQAHYDYYRGEAPFSESETQAIRDFAIEKNFLLSIAYHSSRSGNVSEEVIYSWLWEEEKSSPAYSVISSIASDIASLIPKEVGAGYYLPVAGVSPKGNAHDWFYTQTGCIQFLIEVGTENMQPDSALIEDTIERNLRGAFHLMNRAIGYGMGELGADAYQVTGVISNSETGEPMNAIVKILELDGPMLEPRYTDDYGRYRILLISGTFTLNVSCRGYESQNVVISPSISTITEQNIQLVPLPTHALNVNFTTPSPYNEPVIVVINDQFGPDTNLVTTGNYQTELPENQYNITILGNSLFPQFFAIDLDTTISLDVELNWSEVVFAEHFTNLDNWFVESGDWTIENGSLISQSDLTYPKTAISIISNTIDISEYGNLAIAFRLQYELEWKNDSAFVTLIGENDTTVIYWDNQNWIPNTEYFPIPFISDSIKIQIGILPDSTVEYRGLQVDYLSIIHETDENKIAEGCSFIPSNYSLSLPHPNPFNPATKLIYGIPEATEVSISIYDVLGRQVDQLWLGDQEPGYHSVIWNAKEFTSGIYFIKFNAGIFSQIKKVTLLK